MEVGEASNAVTQFVGDNTNLNIVSIHRNNLKALGDVKILK